MVQAKPLRLPRLTSTYYLLFEKGVASAAPFFLHGAEAWSMEHRAWGRGMVCKNILALRL